MTPREALKIFYEDVKNYNDDMRNYPDYYFNKAKYEPELEKWSKQQDEMYKVLSNALDELDKLREELKNEKKN